MIALACLLAAALQTSAGPAVPTRALSAEVDVLEVRNLEMTQWRITGTLELLPGETSPAFRARTTVRSPGQPPRVLLAEVRAGVYTVVEEAAETYAQGPLPRAGSLGLGNDVWLAPLLLARPWLDGAPRGLEQAESQLYDGETCVLWKSGADKWTLSESSGLPRLVSTVQPMPRGESLAVRTKWTYGEPPTALEPLLIPEELERVELPRTIEVGATPGTSVARLEGSLAPLRDAFNAARGRPRVVSIFAPS